MSGNRQFVLSPPSDLRNWVFTNSERISESMDLLRHFVGLLGRGSAEHSFCTDTIPAPKIRFHTTMTGVGFKPTIPVFERFKTVRALEAARPRVRLYYYYYYFGVG
jgi:hypothetical protein